MTDELHAPESPYKGLRPFEDTSVDALLFFGRDREREVIAANLMAARFTVLYGASGVGKSSVLRAGVVHHLRELGRERAEFAVAVFAGWSDDPVLGISSAVQEALAKLGVPFQAAEGSLRDRLASWSELVGGEIYLVLDQFDEYFLYHGQDSGGPLVEELPSLVTEPGLRVNVLLGIREEALARLDVFKARIPSLFGNYLRLERLEPDAARAAIVRPLERWAGLAGGEHVEIDAGLVEAVLESVTTSEVAGNGTRTVAATATIEPPYLQMVMERVWEAERSAGSRILRQSTLEGLGGARTIVAEHLDRSLASLRPAERDTAATMFAHLVTPSGSKIAHDLGDLASYAGAEETDVRGVASTLVGERILRPVEAPGDGGRVEIFHDVLAGAVSDWRRRHEAERELEAERRRARRRHRRLLALAIASLVAVCAMAAVAAFALVQQREADDQRAEARQQRAEARAQARDARAGELIARSAFQLDIDPQESLRLALEAARLSPGPETDEGLRDALLAARLRGTLPVGTPVVAATFNSAGDRIFALGTDGDLRIFNARRRVLERTVRGPAVKAGAFNAAGSVLVAASRGGTLLSWRAGDQAMQPVSRPEGPIGEVSLSRDGDRVALVGGRVVRVLEITSGGVVLQLEHPGRVSSAAFSKGGTQIVTTSYDGTARAWDGRTGRFRRVLLEHSRRLTDVAISPRGDRGAMVSTDSTGRIVGTATGALLANLIGHSNRVVDVAFSPDGFSIVTASRDRTARVWRAETGGQQAVLTGHPGAVSSAAFAPDGRNVLTVGEGGTVRIWNPQVQPRLRLLLRSRRTVRRVVIGSNGRILALGGAEGAGLVRTQTGRTVRILDDRPVADVSLAARRDLAATARARRVTVRRISTGEVVRRFDSRMPVDSIALSADGRVVATAHSSGTARVWTGRGRLVHVLRGHEGAVTDVAFSPDARRLATASMDGTARIWSAESGRLEHTLDGHRAAVLSVAFRPDGNSVVTTSLDGDARTWNVRSGGPLRVLRGHQGRVSSAAYSADGRWVVTAGPENAGIWQARSGQLLFFVAGHTKRLTSVAFAPDGHHIFTASLDGTVRTYVCEVCASLDGLVALAERRLAAARPS
jgi:WD40 repeat protein